jgi:hypothetical protein
VHREFVGLQGPRDGRILSGMRTLATWKIIALFLALVMQPLHASEADAVDGPNVRVIRHGDGSKSVFTRSPDNRVVVKKTFSAGRLSLITEYRLDGLGNPMACNIYDGQKNRLFRVDYGYSKINGQLVMERMWDCRVKRYYPKNPTVEMPVQVVEYLIDAQGKRSMPIVTSTLPGKTFEEVYGSKTSAMDPKMFDEGNPGKPGGKPAGRR